MKLPKPGHHSAQMVFSKFRGSSNTTIQVPLGLLFFFFIGCFPSLFLGWILFLFLFLFCSAFAHPWLSQFFSLFLPIERPTRDTSRKGERHRERESDTHRDTPGNLAVFTTLPPRCQCPDQNTSLPCGRMAYSVSPDDYCRPGPT